MQQLHVLGEQLVFILLFQDMLCLQVNVPFDIYVNVETVFMNS